MKASGKRTSRAPPATASAASFRTLASVAPQSKTTGAACTTATRLTSVLYALDRASWITCARSRRPSRPSCSRQAVLHEPSRNRHRDAGSGCAPDHRAAYGVERKRMVGSLVALHRRLHRLGHRVQELTTASGSTVALRPEPRRPPP